jgi:predicted CXXCH cytochrome family protein
MKSISAILLALAFFACQFLPAHAADIGVVSSPHNLSTGAEQRVCIFCHTPHHATRLSDQLYTGPLWNRDEITDPFYYTPYVSSTLVATQGKPVSQPQGPSRICLSCHDGTIALASAAHGIAVDLPAMTGKSVLGRDLRSDHPISVEYGLQQAGEYADATIVTSTSRVKLVKRGGSQYVECTSCHDPHDNEYGNFMVVNTSVQADALCSICHTPSNWVGSAHQRNATTSAKGCMNCHASHKAQQGENLLSLASSGGIDTNCTGCHNDTVSPFIGPFTHGNGSDPAGNKHRGAENLALVATWGTDPLPVKLADKHVHCVDCHNPHQAQASAVNPPTPPDVAGVLKGVRGVDINGQPRIGATPYAQYEYEVCFRCHSGDDALGGSFNASSSQVVRIFNSWDERERFNWGTAKSWHPVGAQFTRVGSSQGLSLIVPGTRIIFCNDCHDPHGSTRPHLLRFDNPDTFSLSQSISYPLCYSCHNETYLMSTSANLVVARLHKAHVLGIHQSGNKYRASCSNCHDPHGVPNKFGLTTDSNALHLMNFDTRYAGVGSSYDSTVANPSCIIVAGTSLSCHPNTVNPAPFSTYNSYAP